MSGRAALSKDGPGNTSSSSRAFITEVKGQDQNQKKLKKSVLTLSVRKDYAKLQDVVQHFAKKVDILVDKQRHEYLQAYEHHMSDVQRELFNLREKATAIANDTTREEKIKKLDTDQKWFRNEAMRLDIETNEFRKKMRSIKVTIQSTERERDWLLDKLRAAKEKYQNLKHVRTELFEKYGGAMDGGYSVVSGDSSSYTLELQQTRPGLGPGLGPLPPHVARTSDWREQLQRDYLVKRGEGTTAPLTGGGGGSVGSVSVSKTKRGTGKGKEKEVNRNSIQLLPLDHFPLHNTVATKREEEERKELISALVKERAKADGIRDLIGQCYNCAAVGPWRKLRTRDLSDVLQDCHDLLSDQQELQQQQQGQGESEERPGQGQGEEREEVLSQRRFDLVRELVNYPEIYDTLSHLLLNSHQHSSQQHTQQQSLTQLSPRTDTAPDTHSNPGTEETGAPSNSQQHEQHQESGRRRSGKTSEGGPGGGGGGLCLSDDVLRYFQEERSRREEQELDERGRKVFGSGR